MLAGLGGHAVGMSTVLECIAARWVGLDVCGVSLVTNAGAGYSGEPLSHEEVLAEGRVAGPRLARNQAFSRGPPGRPLAVDPCACPRLRVFDRDSLGPREATVGREELP